MSIEPQDDFAAIAHMRQQTILDLKEAKRLIAKGWCQGTSQYEVPRLFFGSRLKFCTTGAMGRTSAGSWPRAIEMVNAVFAAVFPDRTYNSFEHRTAALQLWNDEPERTKGDVLAAFDCAIRNIQYA